MKYHGKFESPGKGRRLTKVAALSLALVLLVSAGSTLAYLFTATDPVENTFSPAKVSCVIEETMNTDKTAKTYVAVKNTSDVAVYIRATAVINWVNSNTDVCAAPHDGSFVLEWLDDWDLGADGYYYYKNAVPTGDVAVIIPKGSNISLYRAADGCDMQVSFLAQAIQAEPSTAVTEAWGVDVTDGKISK